MSIAIRWVGNCLPVARVPTVNSEPARREVHRELAHHRHRARHAPQLPHGIHGDLVVVAVGVGLHHHDALHARAARDRPPGDSESVQRRLAVVFAREGNDRIDNEIRRGVFGSEGACGECSASALAVPRNDEPSLDGARRQRADRGAGRVDDGMRRVGAVAVTLHALVAQARVIGRNDDEPRSGPGNEEFRIGVFGGRQRALIRESGGSVIGDDDRQRSGTRIRRDEHSRGPDAGDARGPLRAIGDQIGLITARNVDPRHARQCIRDIDLVRFLRNVTTNDLAAPMRIERRQIGRRTVNVRERVRALDGKLGRRRVVIRGIVVKDGIIVVVFNAVVGCLGIVGIVGSSDIIIIVVARRNHDKRQRRDREEKDDARLFEEIFHGQELRRQ